MGIIKKQAFQSSVLIYTGTVIGFLTTGLLTPNLLQQSEIGTLKLLQSYSAIFMSLGVLGFSTITIRYIPKFFDKKNNHYNGFLGISMLVGAIGSVLAVIAISIIKPTIIQNNQDKSPQFAEYFALIIPLTLFQVYYALFDSYNNALYRSSYGVFLRDFIQRLLILAGLVLILTHFIEFDMYVYYYVAAICLPTLLILIHLSKHNALDIHINFSFFNRQLVTSMASVGLFGLLNSFSAIAVIQIDTIMLNMYLDSSTVGIYAITFYFGTLVLVPSRALNKIAPTLISKAYKEKDMDTVKDIYNKSTGNLFLIGLLIFLGLMVNLDNVFNIIPRSYEEGKYVIVFIGLANLIKMAGGSNDSVITYSQYYKMTTVFLGLMILLIVCLNLIFIPILGMTGAALASFIAMLTHSLTKFIFIKVKFRLNPYNLQFVVAFMISGIIYLMVLALPNFEQFLFEILLDSTVTMLLFYLAIKYLPIASELNQFTQQIIEKAIRLIKPKIK